MELFCIVSFYHYSLLTLVGTLDVIVDPDNTEVKATTINLSIVLAIGKVGIIY